MFVIFAAGREISCAQSATNNAAVEKIRIVELQGAVEISTAGTTAWTPAHADHILHPFDRLRTGENSRVALRWSDQSIVPFGAATELEVLPPASPDAQCGLHLIRGIISFFHRDQPGRIQIITRGAVAGVEGTEFVMSVNDADATTLSLVDGKVKFGNEQAALILTNGEQAVAAPGSAPVRTAGFIANNLLQWCFYYPAVIDPDELQLTVDERKNLADSLAAYRDGDLPAALEKFSGRRQAASGRERVYEAALLLSVGEVDKAESALSAISGQDERPQKLAAALRQLIAAVKRQPVVGSTHSQLASELLAESYYEQSRAIRETSLRNALALARQAANLSPKFGFAWERVAELEFSFGQTKNALADLDKSLALAPRNAQALALKGFLLAAQNQTRAAVTWFDRALAADAALGNAWLGRGLCRIRNGDANGGREDLLLAAALEPQRAELRSYLGKAYAHAGDFPRATKELQLAKNLDPNDPTAWLYSALLNQEENHVNDAIRDLEKSQALNANRSVYRSQLLLDQDSAVRSANLAGMYQDAGMFDVSLREAGRAVSHDYANYSAHLFLASSYEQMRDPNWSNLRYDTPAAAEFWIANLLAPTGAGWLSYAISQQPYARLFDRNRLGFVSDTTYLSRGAWTEQADQYYTSGNFSYDIGTSYRYDPGQRPNNDFESREVDINLKGQLTPQDSVFAAVQIAEVNFGDHNQYYHQAGASPDFRLDEKQEPNVFLGYHHEWSPGAHTLFLASRQVADEPATTAIALQLAALIDGGNLTALRVFGNGVKAEISPEVYSTELQQIWEKAGHTTVIGARYEWGDVHYQNLQRNMDGSPLAYILFPDPAAFEIQQDFKVDTHHFNLYGYHAWQIADSLALNVGLSYDYLHQPADVASTPFSSQEKTTGQLSPKIGFIWTPAARTTFRAAYTRSLSDLSNGQSSRLEPTEVAGFNQAFRSLIPESVAGDTSGSQFDTFDVSLEQKFDTGTYFALSGEILYSKLNNVAGAFIYNGDQTDTNAYPTYTSGLRQSMNYRERSLVFTADQLFGKQWSAGARYRLSQANLDLSYADMNPVITPTHDVPIRQNLDSVLHTVNLHANWNHPSGLFSVLEGNWYHQDNSGFFAPEPGDDFWQFNAYAGCRFWHRRAELTVGLLNITDQNYRLEPLNLHNEMTRSRTFLARLKINF